jgi:hypothetical protein
MHNLGLDEFIEWYGQQPRPGFTKATVSAWRGALEARRLGAVSINVRITSVRKLSRLPTTGCSRRSWRPISCGRLVYFPLMAFCTNCGTQLSEGARFCYNCGRPLSTATATAPAPASEPLDYTIQGDNLQVARVRLKPGQELYAEAGKMVYKTANVKWETRMTGAATQDASRYSL